MKERLVILGSGESGVGAAHLAVRESYEVFLSDFGRIEDAVKKELEGLGVSFEEEKHTPEEILTAGLIVKSPGIPDSVSILTMARDKAIPVISEIEFAFRYLPSGTKVIAITGTNGKTTTTLLTHHLLKHSGADVALAGNVGHSLARRMVEEPAPCYVVEVSSFQLDGIVSFRPDVAVLLNITPDHLDRYDHDFGKYVSSKFRIVENMSNEDCFIYCTEDEVIRRALTEQKILAKLLSISTTAPVENGAYLEDKALNFRFTNVQDPEVHRIPTSKVQLIGRHNMINTMAAVLAALTQDVGMSDILQGLKTFSNAPHRLEHVGEISGIRFINDSKATNVDAVYYALEGIDDPIIWIAGGVDKGNDYDKIEALVTKKVKGLVCLGTDNSPLTDFFSSRLGLIEETSTVKDAVETALSWARPGDVVLLSPACASFDLFRSYEDRGDQFRTMVRSLNNNFPEMA